jgi:hypothetical protein
MPLCVDADSMPGFVACDRLKVVQLVLEYRGVGIRGVVVC